MRLNNLPQQRLPGRYICSISSLFSAAREKTRISGNSLGRPVDREETAPRRSSSSGVRRRRRRRRRLVFVGERARTITLALKIHEAIILREDAWADKGKPAQERYSIIFNNGH